MARCVFQRRHFLPELWRFTGHFPLAVAFSPGFAAQSWMFCSCRCIFSRNCGASQDIFFLQWHFLPVLRPNQGCFVAAGVFSPGIVVSWVGIVTELGDFVTMWVILVGIVTDWCDSMTMVLLFVGYCHILTQNCDNAGCFCLNCHRISVLCDRVVPLDVAHGLAA